MPEGVLNVVTGAAHGIGGAMVEHPGVDKIAFTGSTATGKNVAAVAAQTVKRVTLELGGKSPSIVFDDADVDAAVAGALYGVFYNAGQCCEARSRILLQSGIYDRFLSRFVEKSQRLQRRQPGGSRNAGRRHHGPRSIREDSAYCEIGIAEGAKVLGGAQPGMRETRSRAAPFGGRRCSRRRRLAPYRARGNLRSGRDLRPF